MRSLESLSLPVGPLLKVAAHTHAHTYTHTQGCWPSALVPIAQYLLDFDRFFGRFVAVAYCVYWTGLTFILLGFTCSAYFT